MQLLNTHERKLAGIARGVRAAIVLPLLFALSLVVIGKPGMAGFTVFGTFAHLVMVDYSTSKAARLAESGTLTVLGAVLVTLGTGASTNLWLAVASAAGAGCLSQFPTEWLAPVRAKVSVLRSALLMRFGRFTKRRSPNFVGKCRIFRSVHGTCGVGGASPKPRPRILGCSRRCSCIGRVAEVARLHLWASAGRDSSGLFVRPHSGGGCWGASMVVLDRSSLHRVHCSLSVQRGGLHGRTGGVYCICSSTLLHPYATAETCWDSPNRRHCHWWRNQLACRLPSTTWALS
jgi:hypothetical protein